jgi:hypothetical protein
MQKGTFSIPAQTILDIITIILNAHTSFFSYSAKLRQKIGDTNKYLWCKNHVLVGRLVSKSNGNYFLLSATPPREWLDEVLGGVCRDGGEKPGPSRP